MKLITVRTLNHFWEKCLPTVKKICEDAAGKVVTEALNKKAEGEGIKFSVDKDGILCVTYQDKQN